MAKSTRESPYSAFGEHAPNEGAWPQVRAKSLPVQAVTEPETEVPDLVLQQECSTTPERMKRAASRDGAAMLRMLFG